MREGGDLERKRESWGGRGPHVCVYLMCTFIWRAGKGGGGGGAIHFVNDAFCCFWIWMFLFKFCLCVCFVCLLLTLLVVLFSELREGGG